MYTIEKIEKFENEIKKILNDNNLNVENESNSLEIFDKNTFKKADKKIDTFIREKIDTHKNYMLNAFLDYLKLKYNIEPTNVQKSNIKSDSNTSVKLELNLFDPLFDYDSYYFEDWKIPLNKKNKDIIFYIEYDKLTVYLLEEDESPFDGFILEKELMTFNDIDKFIADIKKLLKIKNLKNCIK